MAADLGYDSGVKRLIAAMVAAFALVLTPGLAGQAHGVPASVSSIGFGGNFKSSAGVPASVTSIGPRGLTPHGQFFNQPACCINPLFPTNVNPPLFQRHHHRQFSGGLPLVGVPYAVPYAVPYGVEEEPVADDSQAQAEDYRGGPTIFDRRGPGRPPRNEYAEDRYERAPRESRASEVEPAPADNAPVANLPETVLVFKDGHSIEVGNYAIVGAMLHDLTPGHPRKIPLADLDLTATAKQNDDRGVDFRLPSDSPAN